MRSRKRESKKRKKSPLSCSLALLFRNASCFRSSRTGGTVSRPIRAYMKIKTKSESASAFLSTRRMRVGRPPKRNEQGRLRDATPLLSSLPAYLVPASPPSPGGPGRHPWMLLVAVVVLCSAMKGRGKQGSKILSFKEARENNVDLTISFEGKIKSELLGTKSIWRDTRRKQTLLSSSNSIHAFRGQSRSSASSRNNDDVRCCCANERTRSRRRGDEENG